MSQLETETLAKADDAKSEIIAIDDEDLEDGEIDDSDEEANDNDVVIVPNTTITAAEEQKHHPQKPAANDSTTGKSVSDTAVTVIDLSSDTAPTPPPSVSSLTAKSKKPSPIDDDHAGSIEHAIANALKKKGIEPSIPKILESKLQQSDDGPEPGQGQSKSSRRRKRKKQREEKEKEKERSEKVNENFKHNFF